MSKYKKLQQEGINTRLNLEENASELISAFQQMYQVAYKEGALSTKIKALIGISISVAIRCDDCAYHHVEMAIKNNALREEVIEAIGMAILIGGGPSTHYGSFVLAIYDEFIKLENE